MPLFAFYWSRRSNPAYCCLIDDAEPDDGLPWYHDIYHFLRLGVYPEVATAKDKRALRQLAARFVICGEALYRRSPNGMLLLCLDRASADWVMREVHAGVYGPHMGGHMLARKIMRTPLKTGERRTFFFFCFKNTKEVVSWVLFLFFIPFENGGAPSHWSGDAWTGGCGAGSPWWWLDADDLLQGRIVE